MVEPGDDAGESGVSATTAPTVLVTATRRGYAPPSCDREVGASALGDHPGDADDLGATVRADDRTDLADAHLVAREVGRDEREEVVDVGRIAVVDGHVLDGAVGLHAVVQP